MQGYKSVKTVEKILAQKVENPVFELGSHDAIDARFNQLCNKERKKTFAESSSTV